MLFKHRDEVYCPALTTKKLLVNVTEGCNGMTLDFRGKSYWYNLAGIVGVRNIANNSPYPKSIPSVFLATETNKEILSKLYDTYFEGESKIRIYAVNETNFSGSATESWLYEFRGGFFSKDIDSDKSSVQNFKEAGIRMSPFPEKLAEAMKSNPCGKIICIGHDCISNWSNQISNKEE